MRNVTVKKPYLVRLQYVHSPELAIDFDSFETMDKARAFCIKWVANQDTSDELAQRAEVWRDGKCVSQFGPILDSWGMGADSAP